MKLQRTIILLMMLILMTTFSPTAYAVAHNNSYQTNSENSTRVENTQWYYRTYNGKLQKRLWSITYQKWLTDWIDL